jgi:hypothetical protein
MNSMAMKTATRSRKLMLDQAVVGVHWNLTMSVSERAARAAHWVLTYAEAKPSLSLAGRMWGVSPNTVSKALKELNGNGSNGHTPAPPSLDGVVRWWAAATDADRAQFVRSVGVGSAWRAIEANLG